MVELTLKARQPGCLTCAGKHRAVGCDTVSSRRMSSLDSGEGEHSVECAAGLGDA